MKKQTANIALIVSIVLIFFVLIYGMTHKKASFDSAFSSQPVKEDENVYHLDAHETADFSKVVVEQFRKESRFIVGSREASVTVNLKEIGFVDSDLLFNKTQKITYRGKADFYLDMSRLGENSIRLDNDNRAVIIEIPHTQLAEIEIDPDQFTYEETEKGLLTFGELRFTAKQYNNLEKMCKEKIKTAVNTEENVKASEEAAVEELTKIYEPIIKTVDDSYHVEIVFAEKRDP